MISEATHHAIMAGNQARAAQLVEQNGCSHFILKDAGVSGRGVQAGLTEGNWDELRDLIYRGRGS